MYDGVTIFGTLKAELDRKAPTGEEIFFFFSCFVPHKKTSRRKCFNRDYLVRNYHDISTFTTDEKCVESNISNTSDSVSSGYPNTEKRVENTTRSRVFLTKFEVFGYPMKHCLECLIYLLNRNKN